MAIGVIKNIKTIKSKKSNRMLRSIKINTMKQEIVQDSVLDQLGSHLLFKTRILHFGLLGDH